LIWFLCAYWTKRDFCTRFSGYRFACLNVLAIFSPCVKVAGANALRRLCRFTLASVDTLRGLRCTH
jgi:hypothetical protein